MHLIANQPRRHVLSVALAVCIAVSKKALNHAVKLCLITCAFVAAFAEASAEDVDTGFKSSFLSANFAPTTPAFSSFAVDSLGRGERLENVILASKLPGGSNQLEA